MFKLGGCCCSGVATPQCATVVADEDDSETIRENYMPGDLPELVTVTGCELESTWVPEVTPEIVPMVVQRGEEFVVGVTKEQGSTLGVKIVRSARTCDIKVKGISSGLIRDWNEMHPHQSVRVGDKLIAVDSVRGPSSAAMMQMLEVVGILELTFLKCS